MSDRSSVVECTAVSKAYGRKPVLRALDLQIPAGSVVGLLGKNGAGKTTLLKAALGLIQSDSGRITTLSHDAWDLPPEAKARLGYVPQIPALYPWMKVRHMLDYTASFYPRWDHGLIHRLLGEWELDEEVLIGPLSAGQLQKLAILLALGHRPDLLVLDEPAAALDPVARRAFLSTLLEIVADTPEAHGAGQNLRTVLFSTHITADLERVADRVAILKEGAIVFHDDLDRLKDGVKRLRITGQKALSPGLDLPGTLSQQIDGRQARVCLRGVTAELLARLAAELQASIEVEDLNLDEIFLELHHV